MKTYYYEIHQVHIAVDFAFMSWDLAKKHDWSFGIYKRVWAGFEGAEGDYALLNYLFEKFNLNHPLQFKGHSMSVSDVVKVNNTVNEDEARYYYCDSFGWVDITKEVKGE